MSKFDYKFETWKDDQNRRTYPEDAAPLAEQASVDYNRKAVTIDSLMEEWGVEPDTASIDEFVGEGTRLLPEDVQIDENAVNEFNLPDLTPEQEAENWLRDIIQDGPKAESEIMKLARSHQQPLNIVKKALKEFVTEKYIAKSGNKFKWISNMREGEETEREWETKENEFAAVDGAGKSMATIKAKSEEDARQPLTDRLKKNGSYEEWEQAGSRVVSQKIDPVQHEAPSGFFENHVDEALLTEGYTHYWTVKRDFTAQEWKKIQVAARRIIKKAEKDGIIIRGGSGTGKPSFDDAIWFNGDKATGQSHETFYLAPTQENDTGWDGSNFTKTARKEYDPVVVSVLAAAEKIAPGALDISSDGGNSVFRTPMYENTSEKRVDEAKQKLMTSELRKKLPELYAQENEKDPMVYARFFHAYGAGTWLVTEFDGKDTMFGYVMGLGGDELGYISLRELESLQAKVAGRTIPGLQGIERDKFFKPKRLSQAKADEGRMRGNRLREAKRVQVDELNKEQIEEHFTEVVARSRKGESNFMNFLAGTNINSSSIVVNESKHTDRRYLQIDERLVVGLQTSDGGWCLLREEAGRPYKNLNDAADFRPELARGKTEVWYMKPTSFTRFITGAELPSISDLKDTHILLGKIKSTDKETIYTALQGDFWSPSGEARSLISKLGLRHTSMSIGDVLKIGNKYYAISSAGFKELKNSMREDTVNEGNLWIRAGDRSDYEEFGNDIDAAAEHVAMFMDEPETFRKGKKYGAESDSFSGHDYLSIFWGDDDAQPTKELSASELQKFNKAIQKHAGRRRLRESEEAGWTADTFTGKLPYSWLHLVRGLWLAKGTSSIQKATIDDILNHDSMTSKKTAKQDLERLIKLGYVSVHGSKYSLTAAAEKYIKRQHNWLG